MDERKEPYIEQQAVEDALYTRLGRQTLKDVQRISGKVWTDYNAHDPGVTLADAANYALTELDYKLGFGTDDYLSEAEKPFDAARFGLFPPVDVYTTSPVTEDDYCRMLTANVPGADNVTVHCDPESGGYIVRVLLSPFAETSEKDIKKIVTEAFHCRRNLCEWLSAVEIMRPDMLDFEADVEIKSGVDATGVLARLYWRILRYLSDEADMFTPDSRLAEGIPPEEWLEGSEGTLRTVLPAQKDTEHELYRRLCAVEGVKRFRTCYLTKDGIPQTRLSSLFSLRIPKVKDDLNEKLTLRCGNVKANIDMNRFLELLKGFYLTRGRSIERKRQLDGQGVGWSMPQGTWRDVYTHHPIAADFPGCYRLTPGKKEASAFEAYTRLYDRVITDGLKELEALPRLLSLSEEDLEAPKTQSQLKLRSRYLDFLDRLYGVESNPSWLAAEDSHGETHAGTLRRRVHFLRHVARLERDRPKARNLLLPSVNGNTPAIKEWFCLLLGLNPDDGHTVSNVLPGNNLRLVEYRKDKDDRPGIADRIDSLLIGERMLRPENVRPVEFKKLSTEEEGKRREYAEMRAALPFFNENLITGDLFRGGTRLDSYRTVKTEDGQYMLIYRHRERYGWTNLGQSDNTERLEELANILRRFLRELNRRSETLYIVEPVLADPARTFEVILVLPAWTYRFHSPRFRVKCRELLRSLIPAHLTGTVHWLGEQDMRKFEQCYHQLMHTFTDSRFEAYRRDLLKAIDILLEQAEETMGLNDTD